VTSNSDDEICDVTDDVSECQAEVLPLVGERPIRTAMAMEHRQIAVGDLWSYVADKKLSSTDSLKDEYDVRFLLRFFTHTACHTMRPLSVRLSVTFLDSVKTNKHTFFSPSGSHTILIFLYQTSWQYTKQDHHNGGVECKWSRQKSRVSNIWLSDQ